MEWSSDMTQHELATGGPPPLSPEDSAREAREMAILHEQAIADQFIVREAITHEIAPDLVCYYCGGAFVSAEDAVVQVEPSLSRSIIVHDGCLAQRVLIAMRRQKDADLKDTQARLAMPRYSRIFA